MLAADAGSTKMTSEPVRDRELDGAHWDAPVRYLRRYPEVEIGPRGFLYYICERCSEALQGLPRSSSDGVMLICIWACGQRYWVDDQK